MESKTLSYVTSAWTMKVTTLKNDMYFHIVVVTKKPSMCQIMHFSLYCINGSIEGRHIILKNSNNTLLGMKSELHTEEFL